MFGFSQHHEPLTSLQVIGRLKEHTRDLIELFRESSVYILD